MLPREIIIGWKSLVILTLYPFDDTGQKNSVFTYFPVHLPSFSSKRGHVTEKHVLTGRKHDMLGNQTFEVRRPLSKLSHQSWKAFDVFD